MVLDESIKNLKYNYLNKKIIEIKFKEEVHIDKNKFKVLKSNGYGVKNRDRYFERKYRRGFNGNYKVWKYFRYKHFRAAYGGDYISYI